MRVCAFEGNVQVMKSMIAHECVRTTRHNTCNTHNNNSHHHQQQQPLTAIDEYEMMPLHYAAMHGHRKIVNLLLKQNVPIDARTSKGDTALIIASLRGYKVRVVWCGVVWCGVVWCGVVWCGVVWCVVWCYSLAPFFLFFFVFLFCFLFCNYIFNVHYCDIQE